MSRTSGVQVVLNFAEQTGFVLVGTSYKEKVCSACDHALGSSVHPQSWVAPSLEYVKSCAQHIKATFE